MTAFRLRLRLHRRRLDRQLAAGADPGTTPELRHRAAQLCEGATRRHLAAVLDRIRREADGDRRPFESMSPLARDAIRGCREEIEAIVDRLEDAVAPPARGVAGVALLVHDTESPLLRPETSEPRLREVLEATLRDLATGEA